MDIQASLASLGVALGLGLLVGLQRELADSKIAGFRTFALITVMGAVAGIIAQQFPGSAPWLFASGMLAVTALVSVSNWVMVAQGREREAGITTEVAAIVMFLVGVLCLRDPPTVAVALGVGMAIVLHSKKRLHDIADKLGERDLRAILLFAALTFIVLPVLPNETFGPYDVINPRNIWLMVVLVVGMSLLGYIAYKFAGNRFGPSLAGLIGGLISSTAVTLSSARRAGSASGQAGVAARKAATLAIALASCVVYVRVLVEISIAGPSLLQAAAWPIGAMLVASFVVAGVAFMRQGKDGQEMPDQANPTELKSALVFGALFAGVLLASAWAEDRFGGRGLFAVAAISGAHDMDAITLSTARLAGENGTDAATACRVLVIAATSNMIFKTILAGVFGGRLLAARVALVFAPVAAVGLAVAWFAPLPDIQDANAPPADVEETGEGAPTPEDSVPAEPDERQDD